MDPKRYQRLKDLTQQALDLPLDARHDFLQQECGDDEVLLRDVLRLLAHDRSESDELTVAALPGVRGLSGTTIGPYRIIQPLGEGGMGVVYLAAQSAPLRRQVALKVIKLGMDTKEVITRFESERQALALMDHPAIARVLDAGATDEGRPYFVMEYISGITLTRYCQQHHLGLRRRLELFIQVCRGVHHAHQKGVIHRDIKPSNVLVTEIEGEPVPKIIDFGVAKATGQHLAARTVFTQLGRVVGTPEYMSPEQADQTSGDVDTRSDVFSLGVVLYELLTGVLPIGREELLKAGYDKIGSLVKEKIPLKPSTRISSPGSDPETRETETTSETRSWAKRVRGDLDWITMKALEKDRERRYESAAELATDLVRHLENQAVVAGPPSRIYRLRKFTRRNRAGVLIAAVLLLFLTGFAAWQTVQSQIIARERDKAMANERLSLARGQIDKDPTVAVAYALSSLEILDQPAARDVVRQAVARGPIRDEFPRWGQTGNPITVDASRDGRICAVAWSQTEHPTVGIYYLEDLSMRVFEAPTTGIAYEVTLNADASHVVSNGDDGFHLWRIVDGKHLLHLPSLTTTNTSQVCRLADSRKVAISAGSTGQPIRWVELDLKDGALTELGRSLGSQNDFAMDYQTAIDPSATWILVHSDYELYLQRVEDLDTGHATLVGRHDRLICGLAMDDAVETAASMDSQGHIKVWDLRTTPPGLIREYKETAGTFKLEFDPFRQRFVTSWGSGTAHVYDLEKLPARLPLQLHDRTQWAHDGTFLPDGSLITSRNGVGVARWRFDSPFTWSLHLDDSFKPLYKHSIARDGRVLFVWAMTGEVMGIPLVEGAVEDIGLLGRTGGWSWGGGSEFYVSSEGRRCVAYGGVEHRVQILDFESGKVRDVSGFTAQQIPTCLSTSGRFACFVDHNNRGALRIVDLDSMNVAVTFDSEVSSPDRLEFAGDAALLALGAAHLVRFALANPSASPDTLWAGDATSGGSIFDGGRAIVVRDADMSLTWIDLVEGRELELGTMPGRVSYIDYHPGLGLLAVGGFWETILVFDLEAGQIWTLPVPVEGRRVTQGISFDPFGRWLLTVHLEKSVIWNLPLDPLFGESTHAELLGSLRSLTNVRVVADSGARDGFRITNTAQW